MLYRSLLEGALKYYAAQTKNHQSVIDHYYEKGEGKDKNHSEVFRKEQGISLAMTLHWLLDNKDLFPSHDRKTLHLCVKKARQHIKKMNGVVHCIQFVSETEVISIRNETITLLEFLVTLGNHDLA